jgi:hypothetical protein
VRTISASSARPSAPLTPRDLASLVEAILARWRAGELTIAQANEAIERLLEER